MKRFLAMLLVLCFSLVGVNTMAFAAESTGDAQSTQSTNSTETVANMQSAESTKTSETTESAWEYETPMEYATYNASVCSVGDKIYYIGGYSSSEPSNYNQIYNTKSKTWSLGAPLKTSRYEHSSVVYKNKIYVMGGLTTNQNLRTNSLEIYDTETDTWTNGANMIYLTSDSASVLVDHKIYVIGGGITIGKYGYESDKIQIYDIEKNEWSLETLPFKIARTIAGTDGKNIYILGGSGNNSNWSDNINVYNTSTDTWSTIETHMLSPYLPYTNSTVIGNKIYIACYENNAYDNKSVVCYDMSKDCWQTLPDIDLHRGHSSISSVRNKIYVLGGRTSSNAKIITPVVESLSIADDTTPQLSVLLNQGESVKLSVSKTPSNNSKYTWTSSDVKVATVDANGLVTAVNPGKANIYAENAETKFKESIPVVVVEGVADETRLAVNLDLNQTKQLYLNDDTKNITWSSNDESICTVADGIITAKKNGLAIINATYNDKTYQMYIRVTNA